MDEAEEENLQEILSSVQPYITYPDDLEEVIEEVSENSSDLEDFESNFENLISEEEDPGNKTDYRIFLNKLQSR